MANAVYDDEKQDISNEDLRRITGIDKHEERRIDERAGVRLAEQESRPESVDGQDKKTPSPSEVAAAEADPERGLYNPKGSEEDVPQETLELKRNRRRLVILGAGGTTAVAGISLLIMSFSSMLLSSLSFNMDNDRLARFTRNLMVHTDTIVKTKIALAATDDIRYAEMLRHYGADFNNDTLWAKINRLRPEKVAERLALDLDFEVESHPVAGTNLTRQRITAISYTYPDGKIPPSMITERVVIPVHGFGLDAMKRRIFHPAAHISSIMRYRKDTKRFVDILLAQGNPSWFTRAIQRLAVRSQAAQRLREALDIKTYRWSKADVDRAAREGVQDPLEEEMARSHREASVTASGGDRIPIDADTDARQGAAQTTACTQNPECMRRIIEQGDTLAPDARATLDARFDPNGISNVVAGTIGTVSSLADISSLACRMFDASIMASGSTINTGMGMSIASYASFSAAAGQRIYSDQHPDDQRVHEAQYGGYEWQINGKVGPTEPGGAARSNVYKKAEGKPRDTSESPSPQASAIGSFATNPFGFLPGSAGIALLAVMGDPDAMRTMGFLGFILANADIDFCDVATNLWVQGGLAITELGVALIPGIGQAIKGAGTAISKFAVWAVTKQLAKNIGKAFTLRNLAETGALYAADNIISMIAIAHAVVKMGAVFNGLAAGETYLNQVDAGAEAQGQELVRAFGGRPLTESQYIAAEQADEDFRIAALQNQSFTERYFARTNPQSLVNRLGVASYLGIRGFDAAETVGSIVQSVAKLFNPPQMFAALSGAFGRQSFAIDVGGEEPDSLVLREDYGITQSDWTQDELEATRSNPEYSPLVNEDELDANGRRAEIARKYGRCFDIATPMGDLLAGDPEPGQIFGVVKGDFSGVREKLPAIVRDSNANVDPSLGLCAPDNLGDSGPDGDGKLTFINEEAKLVFRYRVSLANHCAVDQLLAIDTLTDVPGCGDTSSNVASGSGLVNPDGYAFPLDPTLPLGNMPCEQVTCHHDGTGAADLLYSGIEGQPVFAISDGEVLYSTHSEGTCYSIQFKSSKDGYNYWYGHIANPIAPGPVKAGQQIGVVDRHRDQGGDNNCGFDKNGRPISGTSHLHIDRASAPGRTAGHLSDRDPCFIPLLNNIWAVANGKPATYSAAGCGQ